jgi:hypothetical protein
MYNTTNKNIYTDKLLLFSMYTDFKFIFTDTKTANSFWAVNGFQILRSKRLDE